jgi:secreted trypsin-like serine protease
MKFMRVKRSLLAVSACVALMGVSAVVAATPTQAIVGGSNVANGAYSFMASVQRDGFHFCGGSVIADQWVLTAAHCVPDSNAAGLTVRVGSNDNTTGGSVRNVGQVLVHGDFDGRYFDAALLRLTTPVPGSIQKITLANPGNDNLEADGTPVTVAGWGDITPVTLGLLAPSNLQEAALDVVGDANCATSSPVSTVCAEALLKDSCQGDSGGPLFWKSGDTRIQIGIVSHGTLCAIPTFPGVYSEVNNLSIRSFISENAGV